MACVLIGIPACQRDGTLTVADAGAKDLPMISFAEDAAVDLAPPLDMTWLCTADRECTDDRFCQAGQCLPWASSTRGDHVLDGPPIVTARDVTCFDLLAAVVCNRGGSATAGPVVATFHGSDCGGNPAKFCTARTPGALQPGECEMVSCDAPVGVSMWICAGDDGTRPEGQCPPQSRTEPGCGLLCARAGSPRH